MQARDLFEDPWSMGYNDGYRSVTGTTTSVPSKPSLPSGVTDPDAWYYREGSARGAADGKATRPQV
jgi:hypothetical protein